MTEGKGSGMSAQSLCSLFHAMDDEDQTCCASCLAELLHQWSKKRYTLCFELLCVGSLQDEIRSTRSIVLRGIPCTASLLECDHNGDRTPFSALFVCLCVFVCSSRASLIRPSASFCCHASDGDTHLSSCIFC